MMISSITELQTTCFKNSKYRQILSKSLYAMPSKDIATTGIPEGGCSTIGYGSGYLGLRSPAALSFSSRAAR